MFVAERNGKLVTDSPVSLLATHRFSVLRLSEGSLEALLRID
jgi:hypothetical protein